jgi:hypothetical protein
MKLEKCGQFDKLLVVIMNVQLKQTRNIRMQLPYSILTFALVLMLWGITFSNSSITEDLYAQNVNTLSPSHRNISSYETIQMNTRMTNDYDHLVFSFVTPGTNPTVGQSFIVDTYLGGDQGSIRGASLTVLFDGSLVDYVSFNRNVFPGIWVGNNPQGFNAATEENYITRDISTFGSGNLATAPGNSGRITMNAVANGTSPLFYWDNYQGSSNINPKLDLELQPSVITQILQVNAINSTVTIGPAQTELTDGAETTAYNTLRDSFGVIGDGTHTGTISVDITDKQYVMQSVSLPSSGTGAADYTSVTTSVKSGASLRVYEGGMLTMGENQHLVIEDGASLTVDDGASLVIGNGATFAVAGTGTFDAPVTMQKKLSKPDFDNLPGDNTQGLWVALSSPVQGNYSGTGGLLDGLWTQGFPGADSGTGSSNVLVYDETQAGSQLDRYLAPGSNSINPGQGFMVYLYEFLYADGGLDTENPVDYDSPLSMTGMLHATDSENDFTFSVTNETDGYNLLGNPYGTALSWDLSEGSGKWEASGVESFAYLLNPATQQFQAIESGGGQKSMPGILSTAVIDPFDAFWVIANSETPSLKVKEEAFVTALSGRTLLDGDAGAADGTSAAGVAGRTGVAGVVGVAGRTGAAGVAGGTDLVDVTGISGDASISGDAEFSSSDNVTQPAFTLTLSAFGMEAHTGFRFDESYEDGFSGMDARYFSPLGSSFLYLFSRVDGQAVMLNSLDRADGWTTQIPVVAGGYLEGQPLESTEEVVEAEIRFNPLEGLPETWRVSLRDEVTGMEYDLREDGVVRFDVDGAEVVSASTRTKTENSPMRSTISMHSTNSPVMQADLFSDRFTLTIEQLEDEDQPVTPESIVLYQNFPNPFNPSTVFSFDLDTGGVVDLTIYSVDGREVLEVMSERRSAGYHEVQFDGKDLASGLYFYRLKLTSDNGSNAVQVRKMTLLK